MSKRFTETEKWRDVWFRKLTPVQKCLWSYLVDNCDQAGVIDLDLELVSFQIGADITRKDIDSLSKQIETLPSGKLWLVGFVRFQYGTLSIDCKPHKPIFSALERHGLTVERVYAIQHLEKERVLIPYQVGFESLQEKDKDKETEKEQETKRTKPAPESVCEPIYESYPRKVGRGDAIKAIAKAIASGQPPEFLLGKTMAYADAVSRWNERERDFIPHPATWFNGQRYLDDPKAWEPKSNAVSFQRDSHASDHSKGF